MSDEQKPTETVAAEVAAAEQEPVAPAPPATQPPTEEPEAKTEETAAAPAATEEAQAEKEKPKVSRRFTFNKRWGKHRDEPQVPKEPEQPKDPKEDVLGWIGQQIPQAVHKVNHHILEWAQNTAVDEADRKPLPGKDGSVTRNQLLVFLRDGDLLTKLANKLQAGAVEPAELAEGADAAAQKEAQKKNIDNFATWAESALGLQKDQVLSSADLFDKGKNGYPAVFNTLWQLGLQAKDKFQAEGFDVEAIINAASQVVKSNIIQTILGFFRRNRAAAAAVEETKEGDAAAAEGDAAPVADASATEPVVAEVEEPVQKIEVSAPSAVAAN